MAGIMAARCVCFVSKPETRPTLTGGTMKSLLSILIGLIGLAFVAVDAEAARRIGGGKNLGMQRSAPAQQQKAAPATPPQQQTAPTAPAQPQPQPSGLQKWLGPLAGLALGAGLAALFLNNGLGGMLAGMLLVGLIVAALVFVARALMRGRVNPAEPPLQYAGVPGAGPAPSELPGGAGSRSVAATTASAAV